MSLTDKLIEKQKEMGLSDARFATLLGVSRALWNMTRTGDTPLGMKVLSGVLRVFPSMTDDVLRTMAAYQQEQAA